MRDKHHREDSTSPIVVAKIDLARIAAKYPNAAIDRIADAKAAGDNTVIELSEDEVAAFAAITLAIRDKVIAGQGAEAVYTAMQGN